MSVNESGGAGQVQRITNPDNTFFKGKRSCPGLDSNPRYSSCERHTHRERTIYIPSGVFGSGIESIRPVSKGLSGWVEMTE